MRGPDVRKMTPAQRASYAREAIACARDAVAQYDADDLSLDLTTEMLFYAGDASRDLLVYGPFPELKQRARDET